MARGARNQKYTDSPRMARRASSFGDETTLARLRPLTGTVSWDHAAPEDLRPRLRRKVGAGVPLLPTTAAATAA